MKIRNALLLAFAIVLGVMLYEANAAITEYANARHGIVQDSIRARMKSKQMSRDTSRKVVKHTKVRKVHQHRKSKDTSGST